MQWMPGPDPQGDSTDSIRATPAPVATNAAPVMPGSSFGTRSGCGASGPVTRIPLPLASITTTSVPSCTHNVSPLSESVTMITPLLHPASGECGGAIRVGVAGSGVVGDGSAAGDPSGPCVPAGGAVAVAAGGGVVASAESSTGATDCWPHPATRNPSAATAVTSPVRISVSPSGTTRYITTTHCDRSRCV